MKKEEAIKEKQILLKKLKEIQEIIDKPEITPEQRFLEILNGCEIKIEKEKYPNSVFLFKNGECYFEIENLILWCRYKHVWQIFENEFYKLDSGGIIGIDSSYIESEEPIYSPFDKGFEVNI